MFQGCRIPVIIALLALASCQRSTGALPPMPPMPPMQSGAGGAGGADSAARSAPVLVAEETDTMDRDNASGAILPGSIEDFIEQSGSDRVLFAYNSQDLDDTAKAILRRQAVWLTRYPRIEAVIEGHTDENGTREFNYALGARRAATIRSFLATQGVDPARLSVISFGKDRPQVEASDDAGFAQNRRGITVLSNAATR